MNDGKELNRAEQMSLGAMCVNLGCQLPAVERIGGLANVETDEAVVLPLCATHASDWKTYLEAK